MLGLCSRYVILERNVPLSIAAFPDLMAREAILAITSGRASKIINRTPIGHVNLSSKRPSSSFVLRVILLTISYISHRVHTSQSEMSPLPRTVVYSFCKTRRTIHQPSLLALRRDPSPGSSSSRTSSIPCIMSSHLPFLAKSNLFSTL